MQHLTEIGRDLLLDLLSMPIFKLGPFKKSRGSEIEISSQK
jgi:hypothetical protein